MRVAYLVLCHRLPGQVARLVRALDVPGAAFFIHLDRNAGAAAMRRLARELAGRDNVRLVPRRRVAWASWSVVAATLDCLRELERTGADPAQTVLLTGQDYPIQPAERIAADAAERPGTAYIRHRPLPIPEWGPRGGLERVERVHLRVGRRRQVALPWQSALPGGLRAHGGSQLWSLGRPQRRYVLETIRGRPELVRFFRRTAFPDETFFQTILACSPLRDTLVNDNRRYIRWTGGVSPDTLRLADLPELRRSPALFARKLDARVDAALLDAIDEELLSASRPRESSSVPTRTSPVASTSSCSS
jgi:Core-2/I-Branching enzyme